jgi:transposase
MGRPKKLDDAKVRKLRARGLSIRAIAAKLGASIGGIQKSLARGKK